MESNYLLLACFKAVMIGLGAGIIGAVYREILAYGPVLGWWFRFGTRFESRWFWPAVWGCAKCIAGQLGLWFYVFTTIQSAKVNEFSELAAIIFGLLFAICLAIAIAFFLTKAIQLITDK